MKPQQLIASLPVIGAIGVASVDAFVTQTPCHSFTTRRHVVSCSMRKSSLSMDMEGDYIDQRSRHQLEQTLYRQKVSLDRLVGESRASNMVRVEKTESSYGMPWRQSIGTDDDDTLLYMPFWEWQMDFMKDNLSNLRVAPCADEVGQTDFSFNENTQNKARIVNMCFASDEYRKIRMSYYDAGDNTQVFNSVWYPDPKYNLPVLGIDLLSFNRKKFLAIVDFQPLHDNEDDHASTYEHILRPIKNKYDSLKGRMSSKFYDETQFFSQEMLFARFEDERVIERDLMPAFQRYVQAHLDLIGATTPDDTESEFVLDRQRAYDTYSAERDPATGLFAAMFGKEWADDFVHGFLFSMSERKEGGVSSTPRPMGMGGPPPQARPAMQQEVVPVVSSKPRHVTR